MKCYKERELIIFDFEDGKRATYNLNTGETIGKTGRTVQSLCHALAGYDIDDVLNSFTDERYRKFLLHVRSEFTPHTYNYYHRNGSSRVQNLGTLFKYVNQYKIYEQYFIAGINADSGISIPLSEVPKGLLKLCRVHDKKLTNGLIHTYRKYPNEYNIAFAMEFENLNPNVLWPIMSELCGTRWGNGCRLLTDFKYNLQALLKYMDYLETFEGVYAGSALVREIGDYANMMSQISNKYEKYPRYFLSTHKIAARNYERLKRLFDEQNFAKRIKPEYEITHKDYKFFYPRSTQEIKDEAVQQQNCVASYIDRVIEGSCDILFLRKKDAPSKSVVTIEVRNGTIVQAFQAYNTPCNEEQREAIDAFNRRFGK